MEQLLLRAKQSELLFAEISGVACPAAPSAHCVNRSYMNSCPLSAPNRNQTDQLPKIILLSKKKKKICKL